MPLLLTPWQSFLHEHRIMTLLNEAGPIRVPQVRMVDTDAGVLMFEMIDGPRLGPEWPTELDPADLARAIAVAQTIGRFWPPTPDLARLPVTDHLRRYLDRGLLNSDDAITIASALAVRPIKWAFAHGGLSARTLIREPTGVLAVIDWEPAGIYPAGYDLAFLWFTTRAVPEARQTIEAAVPANHRSSFFLSALLIALQHLDPRGGLGPGIDSDLDRADAEGLMAQLGAVAQEGSVDTQP